MNARRIAPALFLAPAVPGCVFAIEVPCEDGHHGVHVDASARRGASREDGTSRRPEAGVLSGRVVDAEGNDVNCHVSAVRASGSWSMGTDGTFEFDDLDPGEYVVKATTEDGRVGLQSGLSVGRRRGVAGVTLHLEPGAALELSFDGPQESLRCAVFHDGLRVDDFTLRRGKTSRTVVPPGRIPIQLYAGDSVLAVREVQVEAGDEEKVAFDLEG